MTDINNIKDYMPNWESNINILIKPVSGDCNLKCRYCFYSAAKDSGRMSGKTIDEIAKKLLAHAKGEVVFAFQGGEPTLAGLGFYKSYIEAIEKYKDGGTRVLSLLQTNGYIIDQEWAEFLARNNFLVGLSIDGTKEVHDFYRGEGSHAKAMRAARLFNSTGVEFNVLSVVTRKMAKRPLAVYNFFKKNNFKHLQHILCIDDEGIFLTSEEAGEFLVKTFDIWFADFEQGYVPYIRWFDNIMAIVLNEYPEMCGMAGRCSEQYVIEADGSVYPCDFYVQDRYYLGNFLSNSIEELDEKRRKMNFITDSLIVSDKCKHCKWLRICRGGCRRYRDFSGRLEENRFCEAYNIFFDACFERLLRLCKELYYGHKWAAKCYK